MSMLTRLGDRRDARRRAILNAARRRFLRFGYEKTSLADIALEALLSRPLLYLQFKSKEEILAAVFQSTYEEHYAAVAELVRGGASQLEKLAGVYERLFIDPFAQNGEFEGSLELTRICARVIPSLVAAHERRCLRYTQSILHSKELAEIFELSVAGLRRDVPSATTFRKRLHILAARFAD